MAKQRFSMAFPLFSRRFRGVFGQDKREEEYQKQRDEVQALFAKVHRRLQSELIELRDYKASLKPCKAHLKRYMKLFRAI